MTIFCRFYNIGIQLLFLLHVAHSFVLLTANVEDVKKLASKFVSESLAEKIANFITRFAGNLADTDTDTKGDRVSEENYKYNIARERNEENIDDKADISASSFQGDPENEEEHIKNLKDYEKKSFDRILRENLPAGMLKENQDDPVAENGAENKPEYDDINDLRDKRATEVTDLQPEEEPTKPYSYPLSSQENSKVKKAHSRYIKKKPRPSHSKQTVPSTSGYAEIKPAKSVRKGKRLKARMNRNRNHKTPGKEVGMGADVEPKADSQMIDDNGMVRAFKELTTKKMKNEFDQYENINYPKSELIATSGPVGLPKMPASKRKQDDGGDSKKYWF